MTQATADAPTPTTLQTAGRLLLGSALIAAGTAHLTFARDDFPAQVPDMLTDGPLHLSEDFIVVASGVAEIALGTALLALPQHRRTLGWISAGFFTAVFPGNVSQYLTHADAFGLDTDGKRFVRLLFQPVLVAGALWTTGALGSTEAGPRRR
ncbi:membrane protein [Deinococcus piscis]|uniref:Membrane protein n=1 Tax=Deinococcus piscis TaxID=394230 RepID=A0ABQ3KEI0_9DEIO|nr:hypothetical protein [Deinococcus piscis]GHG12239.1 membrane protein [Deinococcus piscis]